MSTSALRVDRKAGIIYGVKVLGLVSENGRRYTPSAVKAAARLYEGVRVNVDHPEKDASQPRSAYDRLGKLINIRYVEGEGLYGDLEILMTHPMAKRICEAAERMPDAFGMSHNAQGEGDEDKDGTFVVNKIAEVRHVDLVADPATTKSLSESAMKKIKESNGKAMQIADEWSRLQKIAADNAHKAKDNKIHQAWSLRANQLANITRTAYMQAEHGTIPQGPDTLYGGMYAKTKSTTTELPEGASPMDDKLKEALKAMREAMDKLEGCMESYDAEEADDEDKKDDKKAMESEDDSAEEGQDEDDEKTNTEEGADEDSQPAKEAEDEKDAEEGDLVIKHEDDDDNKDKKAMEGKGNRRLKKIAQENQALKAREQARALCEAAGIKADSQLLADLAVMPKDAAKRTVQRLAGKANKPKSGYTITESRAGGIPDGDALFTWLAN